MGTFLHHLTLQNPPKIIKKPQILRCLTFEKTIIFPLFYPKNSIKKAKPFLPKYDICETSFFAIFSKFLAIFRKKFS